MKKQFAALLATTLISGVAFAAPAPGTIGVGIAHTESTLGSDDTIFLPYTLNDGLWVEPFISYSNEDNGTTENTNLTIGAGLFKDFHSTAKTRAYFGGRLGYIYADQDPGSDDNGLLVQPVLGFGYEPVNNLILGAEAFVSYEDNDDTNTENYGTGTSLFVRYFFNQ